MNRAEAVVGTMGPGDHVLFPYASDDQQRDAVAVYVRDGVARSERVFYLADHTTPDALDPQLRASGQLVHAYLADMLVPFDVAAATAMIEQALKTALAEGYTGIRMTAEMTWALRDGPGCDGACAIERVVGEALPRVPVTALCQYDLRECAPPDIAALRAIHAGVIEDLLLRIQRSGPPPVLRLIGEADLSTFDVLAAEVRAAPDGTTIDLSALDFADVRTLRLLATSDRLALRSPSPILARVLGLL